MQRSLSIAVEHYPIAGSFRISRGAKTEAAVVTCTIAEAGIAGHGECVPYGRYGESVEGIRDAVAAMSGEIARGMDRHGLIDSMPPGAARNAIDCAMWDLEAKLAGIRVSQFVCRSYPRPLETAYTISLGLPDRMAADAYAASHYSLLKIKLGGADDPACMRAVAEAAPNSRFIADANEGWTEENLAENIKAAAANRIELIEQPLPAGNDEALRDVERTIAICADESAHIAADLDRLAGRYDAVNIKLDKAGGLTAAIAMQDRAKALGMKVMVGCMVGTSLAMAPAVLLAQDADYVDLDGPLLLARDRIPGLHYENSMIFPPESELWG